jgi:hypothetical protein
VSLTDWNWDELQELPRRFEVMRFTLYYDGELPSAANSQRLKEKHAVREKLHWQILQLFRDHPALPKPKEQDWARWPKWAWPQLVIKGPEGREWDTNVWEEESSVIEVGNLHYFPLITSALDLICDLDVLFLRPGAPGLMERGAHYDIDNRLLTLFDGLTVPTGGQCAYSTENNKLDPNSPIFCLLADDSRITAINVRTDSLLAPAEGAKPNDVRLVIGVTVRASRKTWGNATISE